MIGVVRRLSDLEIILSERWYRVPARRTFLRRPRYLAFYLTKRCGPRGGAVTHYAPIKKVSRSLRRNLLPREKSHPGAGDPYWKFHLGEVRKLPRRIENKLQRRITFAYTTIELLLNAHEVGELFRVPPLEEIMRKLLEKSRISFKTQFCVIDRKKCRYRLDFAVFCKKGKLALECDHSRWHSQPARRKKDRRRDLWLRKRGWTVIRFREEDLLLHPGETIEQVRKRILELGGQ